MDRRRIDRQRRGPAVAVIFEVLVGCGIVYHVLAIVACLRFRRRGHFLNSSLSVSILKPVRGKDEGFYNAIRSHALLDYPAGFELLFGVSDPADPALREIERLRHEYPALPIRIIDTRNDAPNGKVGALEILLQYASHDIIVSSDSDIHVEPDYLSRVVGSLEQENVGLVTCLYRGQASSIAARAECLGISTEFAPSVLVADLLSASAFASGSTIALRRRDLEAIGGFHAIRNHLADDYQLGARIAKLGKRVMLGAQVVETSLGDGSWADVWKHQVRWSRTIRVSNHWGYAGYGITQLTFWCLTAAACGRPGMAAAGLLLRMASGLAGTFAMRDSRSVAMILAVPFRDLFGTAVWFAGLVGNSVEWRGLRFRLRSDGTIYRLS